MDATIIHWPSSPKTADEARAPEMHQTRRGNQWYFGVRARIGGDEFSGVLHHVIRRAANVGDVTVTQVLLNRKEQGVLGDSGYTRGDPRPEVQTLRLRPSSPRGEAK